MIGGRAREIRPITAMKLCRTLLGLDGHGPWLVLPDPIDRLEQAAVEAGEVVAESMIGGAHDPQSLRLAAKAHHSLRVGKRRVIIMGGVQQREWQWRHLSDHGGRTEGGFTRHAVCQVDDRIAQPPNTPKAKASGHANHDGAAALPRTG